MCRREGVRDEGVAGVTGEVTFEQGPVVIEKGGGILKAHHHSPHVLIAVHLLGLLKCLCSFMQLTELIVMAKLDFFQSLRW